MAERHPVNSELVAAITTVPGAARAADERHLALALMGIKNQRSA